MPIGTFAEPVVEDAALTWFGELGYAVGYGNTDVPSETVFKQAYVSGMPLAEVHSGKMWVQEAITL
jgi:hypothetical protein